MICLVPKSQCLRAFLFFWIVYGLLSLVIFIVKDTIDDIRWNREHKL